MRFVLDSYLGRFWSDSDDQEFQRLARGHVAFQNTLDRPKPDTASTILTHQRNSKSIPRFGRWAARGVEGRNFRVQVLRVGIAARGRNSIRQCVRVSARATLFEREKGRFRSSPESSWFSALSRACSRTGTNLSCFLSNSQSAHTHRAFEPYLLQRHQFRQDAGWELDGGDDGLGDGLRRDIRHARQVHVDQLLLLLLFLILCDLRTYGARSCAFPLKTLE